MRIKSFFRMNKINLILLIISSVIGLILGIIIYELYFYIPKYYDKNWYNPNTKFDSELGWSPILNRSDIPHVFNTTVSSNSLGFRSPEVDDSKDHILIIGDSVAYGYGVNDNETSSHYLQGYLNQKYKNLQVLNLGVSGYGPDQYYLHLKRNINNTNPRAIIVIFYTNGDLYRIEKNHIYGRSKPLFIVNDNNKLVNINPNINKHSCINLFSSIELLHRYSFLQKPYYKFCKEKKLDPDMRNRVFSALLKEIDNLATQYNSSLIFVLSPSRIDYEKESFDLSFFREYFGNRNYRKYFGNSSYNYLDYYEYILNDKEGINKLYLGGDIAHYSPHGNKYLAEKIYKYLLEQLLI